MSSEKGLSSGTVQLPIPISFIAKRYYLFDIDHISYLRREHNISGVLSGTLPQACNQNVFLGLPLELLPEEAKLLTVNGIACIIEDTKLHRNGVRGMTAHARAKARRTLASQGTAIATQIAEKKQEEKEAALRKHKEAFPPLSTATSSTAGTATSVHSSTNAVDLFSLPDTVAASSSTSFPSSSVANSIANTTATSTATETVLPYVITPTTSALYSFAALSPSSLSSGAQRGSETESLLPDIKASRYALFEYLHARGYFLSPGLRFGCPFMAYPGDPLRFHSHFLVRPVEEEEEESIPVMDLVATGRLGTGVKKGLLIGGLVSAPRQEGYVNDDGQKTQTQEHEKRIRCFTLEWSGM